MKSKALLLVLLVGALPAYLGDSTYDESSPPLEGTSEDIREQCLKIVDPQPGHVLTLEVRISHACRDACR